jgi:hypothetical protein
LPAAREPVLTKHKKALVLKCARELFLKDLRFIDGRFKFRRNALAVFIVEQVALNRHAFGFQCPEINRFIQQPQA